ncbi:hypothetical protein [Silvimonas amylolytica]|uniref:DUF485 domain-containing protein n=1 Tax=Silvimonas amylolytica TaxID=449663 RepID=A0ABQ2PHY2_9NEIS|nr:hypothetical protein [Silvimonas amylolytica]GGP24925.1 hypothetical protein GCM10010971_07440 [Silvimonas amylolytica]
MKLTIKRVSVLRAAKMAAIFYLVISIPMMLLMLIQFSAVPAPNKPGLGWLILVPVMYTIIGFLFTLFSAWLYNMVARWQGGLEFEVSEEKAAI